MNIYDFTYEDVRREVLALADDHPDATYKQPWLDEPCRYNSGKAAGDTGCLFGQAFRALAVADADLDELDRRRVDAADAIEALTGGAFALSFTERREARRVQGEQDDGHPWAHAVKSLRDAGADQ